MKRTITLAIAVAALAAFAQVFAAEPEPQRQGTDFRFREPLAAGRTLEIRGINGNVSAEPSASGEVEVVATKRARRSDPDEVRVEVVRHAGGVLICAVYPNPGGEPNTCELDNSRSHVHDNDTSVNFTVRVPAGVNFNGRTVNGEVKAEDLNSDVDAKTVNGSINVSTRGLARAATVNGSITASLGRGDWPSGIDFKTVNGAIDLSLPASLNAHVEAKTLNGEISSDFPLTVEGSFSRRRLSGDIGNGGERRLNLETVNGGIHLRRAS